MGLSQHSSTENTPRVTDQDQDAGEYKQKKSKGEQNGDLGLNKGADNMTFGSPKEE